MIIHIIGNIATILILVSMLFKTTNRKSALYMRILNAIGSIIFVIYGILVPAYSTAVLNAALALINIYHIIILLGKRK